MTPASTQQDLADLYRHLHAHPELSFQEHETAAIVARSLKELGFEVHEGIGGTGVAGVLARGEGPVVALRADMDGLPIEEATGLDYASRARGVDRDGREVPVMHGCGHDVHVTALLGAAAGLAANPEWAGTLVTIFQPAEELGSGAQAMVDGGLYDLVPRPDVVLGQHVAPLPAGMIGLHPGASYATSDSLRIRFFGRGGHASRPEVAVDPVVMAAAFVMRAQTIVSREVAGTDTAVLTVGTFHAGTKVNIIPDDATVELNVRTYDADTRDRILGAIRRIARAEALASGANREPSFEELDTFPILVNDPDGCRRTVPALASADGVRSVIDPGPASASEDVGVLATAVDAPCVYWILGGADPRLFADATSEAEMMRVLAGVPANHSPQYAPAIEPTLEIGVSALQAAALEWFGDPAEGSPRRASDG